MLWVLTGTDLPVGRDFKRALIPGLRVVMGVGFSGKLQSPSTSPRVRSSQVGGFAVRLLPALQIHSLCLHALSDVRPPSNVWALPCHELRPTWTWSR